MKKPTMEELFATIPDAPDDLVDVCMEFGPKVPIYYRRHGKYADCRCGNCNAVYMVEEKPSRGAATTCPRCGCEGRYEWMKVTRTERHYYTVVLIQARTDGGLVLRYFGIADYFKQGSKREFYIQENVRYMLNLGDFYKFNRQYGDIWSTQNRGTTYQDYVYPGWEEEIKKSEFKYFEYAHLDLIDELKAFSRNPGLEMFEKIGLTRLKKDLVWNEGRSKYINRRAETLKKQLHLRDKAKINYLIERNGDIELLHVLQFEEKNQLSLKQDQRKWLWERFKFYEISKKINHLMEYMTFSKMYNRIQKYKSQEKERTGSHTTDECIIRRYDDYLTMREDLDYDMTNEIFIYPKDLKQKHDEMVAEKNARKDELHEVKKEKQFDKIPKRLEQLEKKYCFDAGGYFIRPAKNATEIIREGRYLHHCVGGDNYLRKHNEGKTFILFLRKIEAPDEPYYTIEVKEDSILQWYGVRDGKPDKEIIGPWLDEYVKHLGKTRTKTDLKEDEKEILQAAV